MLRDLEAEAKKGLFNMDLYLTNAQINASRGLARIGMEPMCKETKEDMATGLKSMTHFGRPDWNVEFSRISGYRVFCSVSVFFCGPDALAAAVRPAALHYGFSFRKENF